MDTKLIPIWQWMLLLALLAGAVYTTETLIQHERQIARGQQLRHEIASAGQLRALLESELNIPLYLTIGLTAHVQARNGDISPAEMHLLLPELAHQARHIRNIGVAPGNTLRYIYPLMGNEQALDLYYPDLPEQWPDIAAIIEQREARLVGPVQLIQGGTAFIYRVPVYMNADSYWGIISTVVDIDSVWALLQRQTTEQEVQVAIRGVSPQGVSGQAFYGDNRLFFDDSLQLDISLRGALWQMALRSSTTAADHALLLRSISYGSTAVLLALLLWLFISHQSLRRSAAAQQHTKLYLRGIMDNVADAIITTDPDGIIEQANMSCYPMFGYSPASLPGHHWSILLAEPQRLDELYSATSDAHNEYLTSGRRRDNSQFSLAVSRSRLQLLQQTKQLLVLRDISAHLHAEQLKQQFISTVSHELRPPIAAISGALGLLMSGAGGTLSSSQLRMLQLAKNNCQQVLTLQESLLDVEKAASGTLSLDMQQVDLYTLLQLCIKQCHLLHPTVQLQLNGDDSAKQLTVNADAARLQQIVSYLLHNAVRYSGENGQVQLSLSQEGKHARIMVQDNGNGVAEHRIPQLFSRFNQTDKTDRVLQSGTGLGLAVSRSIINQMQGSIGFKPAPQQGSCFYIDLPITGAIPG
ncbi:ATP-binding protein [Rheinheimera muenzenbergensis]|uniref:histidine kinase n=1 Tax=Rheinheimera muenzenbergensis TaxID=1193628 RepID=A0ABU8CAY1_9GAMM